jgi:MarR family transcriptional regulator, 2-MHQ and catechol-resistance regulon repressor
MSDSLISNQLSGDRMATKFKGNEKEIRALNSYIKLVRATEAVNARTGQNFMAAGLSVSQFGVLEALLHGGPLCQRDLARKILKSTGNITMVIDNLEKRGLVLRERDSGDRRFITIHLSDAGRELIAAIFPKQVAAIVAEMSALTDEEQEELARLCRKLGLKEDAGKTG